MSAKADQPLFAIFREKMSDHAMHCICSRESPSSGHTTALSSSAGEGVPIRAPFEFGLTHRATNQVLVAFVLDDDVRFVSVDTFAANRVFLGLVFFHLVLLF